MPTHTAPATICLQFKPAPPNAIGSPEYIADLAEVFAVGRNDSSNRTQEQTDTARFWADGNSEWRGGGGEIDEVGRVDHGHATPDMQCMPHRHSLLAFCPSVGCSLPTSKALPATLLNPPLPAATSAVSGHFNQIAQVLLSPNATVEEAALLFAVLNAAQWDASIAGYTAKYAQPSWRPITAIK